MEMYQRAVRMTKAKKYWGTIEWVRLKRSHQEIWSLSRGYSMQGWEG